MPAASGNADIIRLDHGAALAVGNEHDAANALHGAEYNLVVYTAREVPAPEQVLDDPRRRRKVRVFSLPLEDAARPLNLNEAMLVSQGVRILATQLRLKKRILVTSKNGINRACYIAALILAEAYGCGGEEAVRAVRRYRARAKRALENPAFLQSVANVPRRPNGVYRLELAAL